MGKQARKGGFLSRLCLKFTRVKRFENDEADQEKAFTSAMPSAGYPSESSMPSEATHPGALPDEDVGHGGAAGVISGTPGEWSTSADEIGFQSQSADDNPVPETKEQAAENLRVLGSLIVSKKADERIVAADGETKKVRKSDRSSFRASRNSKSEQNSADSLRSMLSVRASTARLQSQKGEKGPLGAVGKPFPKRPMACKLSGKLWSKLEELFRLMDQDGSNAVTREEAKEFFSGAFAKMSAEAMFNEVDVDGSGAITAEEFVQFWLQVRSSGYKEQDIQDEVDEMLQGGAWVDWKDERDTTSVAMKFPKRPLMSRLSVKCWSRCEELFHAISGNDPLMAITPEKAARFFKGAFCNISADAMFNEIDLQHHGTIRPKDFMLFWLQVRQAGYKEKDILEEIDNLLDGNPWVDWKDGRRT